MNESETKRALGSYIVDAFVRRNYPIIPPSSIQQALRSEGELDPSVWYAVPNRGTVGDLCVNLLPVFAALIGDIENGYQDTMLHMRSIRAVVTSTVERPEPAALDAAERDAIQVLALLVSRLTMAIIESKSEDITEQMIDAAVAIDVCLRKL